MHFGDKSRDFGAILWDDGGGFSGVQIVFCFLYGDGGQYWEHSYTLYYIIDENIKKTVAVIKGLAVAISRPTVFFLQKTTFYEPARR